MRKLVLPPLCAAAVLTWSLTLPAAADAQVFSDAEIERGLRPGPRSPYDGVGVMQRYNYQTGAILYLNGSARQLNLMDYYDRLDRAERFGYRLPPDPFRRRPVVVDTYPCPCDGPQQ
jgi:hypothetical protein